MIEFNGHTYYRIREVAAILHKTPQAVNDDVRAGRMAAVLVGNVRHVRCDDLNAFVGGRREVPAVRMANDHQMRMAGLAAREELRRRGYGVKRKPTA